MKYQIVTCVVPFWNVIELKQSARILFLDLTNLLAYYQFFFVKF